MAQARRPRARQARPTGGLVKRGRRLRKIARQVTAAQALAGEALVELAGTPPFGRPRLASFRLDQAAAALARARRGVELLAEEERAELHALDRALDLPASRG